MEGPAIMLHRPSCVPEGLRVEQAGVVLTSNRWFSHPTGTWAPSQQGFYPPLQSSFSIRFAIEAQLQDSWLTMGIAGTKEHSGTCQGAKGSGMGLIAEAPPAGQPNTSSLPPLWGACARPMLGLYNHCFLTEPPLCSAWWVSGPPIFKGGC